MRIYICGSFSNGKTTLARYISEKYKLPMITEVARTILSEKELSLDSLRSDMKAVDSYQSDIFYRQIEEEAKMKDNFVSDRTFDCLAFAAQHSNVFPKLIHSQECEDYIESLRENSIIFFVRPSKATLKSDGVREDIVWDQLIAIDAMVKLLLNMFDLNYFNISTDSMQERTRLVDSVLALNETTRIR